MLKNLSTKMKLLLFPLMFIAIVIICAIIYVNKSNLAEKRNEIAIKTEVLIQELLKGRIAVYQYMRNPSDETALKVKDTFKSLDSEVTALKNILVIEKNRVLCDEILSSSKQYISDFESYSSKYTKNPQETPELKEIISNMVKAGGVLESKIKEINNTAIELRIAAYESLNTILSIVAIVAILIFILISLFISKIVANSLDNFKSGLISFFSYLNRSSNQISLLDDTAKDEFGEMAKFVNDNIKQIEKTINQDNLLIDDAKVVMSRVNNGWYSQFIKKSTSNTSLEEFKNNVNKMIESTRKRFEEVDVILEEYARLDYRKALRMHPNDEKGGVFERLVIGINTLQTSITQMLIDNKTNGLTLDASSDILLVNVDKLNQSSNEAADSL